MKVPIKGGLVAKPLVSRCQTDDVSAMQPNKGVEPIRRVTLVGDGEGGRVAMVFVFSAPFCCRPPVSGHKNVMTV